jgi:hypothetical protein
MTNEEPQTKKWHLRGGNPPAVNPADLKKVWQASADYEAHHPGENSISDTFYQSVCGPGVDVESAWYRVSMLLVLKEMMPELFESWTHGTELDDAVVQVAASFPMGRASVAREGPPFDVDEFVKQVGAKIKKPGAS